MTVPAGYAFKDAGKVVFLRFWNEKSGIFFDGTKLDEKFEQVCVCATLFLFSTVGVCVCVVERACENCAKKKAGKKRIIRVGRVRIFDGTRTGGPTFME